MKESNQKESQNENCKAALPNRSRRIEIFISTVSIIILSLWISNVNGKICFDRQCAQDDLMKIEDEAAIINQRIEQLIIQVSNVEKENTHLLLTASNLNKKVSQLEDEIITLRQGGEKTREKQIVLDESLANIIERIERESTGDEGIPKNDRGQGSSIQPHTHATNETFTSGGIKSRNLHSSVMNQDHCAKFPMLSPINRINNFVYDERIDRTLSVIQALSSTEALLDNESSQYRASCWILYSDILDELEDTEALIQTYSMAVFFFSAYMRLDNVTLSDIRERLLPKYACEREWFQCNDQNHVINITWNTNTSGFFRQSSLPREISNFRMLENIEISTRKIIGTIPPELGHLSRLKTLYLQNNALTGTIPKQLGLLSNLQKLNVAMNQLSGTVPSELKNLEYLVELDLGQNNLKGRIPVEIIENNVLESLDLSHNSISGEVPSNIGMMKSIKRVSLNDNFLTGHIPSEIGNLTSLQRLWLSDNKFSGPIPLEMKNLQNLITLSVKNNHFQGSIPPIFKNMTDLTFLLLSNNSFTGSIPLSLWELNSLFRVDMHDNDLVGKVPYDFCGKVRFPISVDGSRWFMNEPKVDCDCCNTIECYVDNSIETIIEGIPRSTCLGSSIEEIEVFEGYNITDLHVELSIDEFIGTDVTDTKSLCLSKTGCYAVDSGISTYNLSYSASSKTLERQDKCDAVNVCGTEFRLDSTKRKGLNHLTQKVISDLSVLDDVSSPEYKALCWAMTLDRMYDPRGICNGIFLQRFVMALFYYTHENTFQFSTFASQATCDWPGVTCDDANMFVEHLNFDRKNMQSMFTNLSNSVISNEKLSGSLISQIGMLSRLKTINFRGNNLEGDLKSITSALPLLESIDLSRNKFEGELPAELLVYPFLKHVNISHNGLTGTIPVVPVTKSLETFEIGFNMMHGPLPEALFACPELRVIDLSRNSFVGSVPARTHLHKLRVMNLHANRLSGTIPIQFFHSEVEEMMLNTNSFTGSIPTQIGLLTNATVIRMNHNSMRGTVPAELSSLRNIQLLHLHQNEFSGDFPVLTFLTEQNNRYISDCLSQDISCASCTICCTSESDTFCEEQDLRKFPLWFNHIITAFFTPIGVWISCLALNFLRAKGWFSYIFQARRETTILCNKDSVYCFIFSNHIGAWTIYLLCAIGQVLLFFIFLNATKSAAFSCLGNEFECEFGTSVANYGWVVFFVVTLVYLGPDLVDGTLKIAKSTQLSDIRFFFSGFGLLFLTSLALSISFFFNQLLAKSNSELIVNAVILLFVNDLDEKLMLIMNNLCPQWIDDLFDEIDRNLLAKEKKLLEIEKNFGSKEVPSFFSNAEKYNDEDARESLESFAAKTKIVLEEIQTEEKEDSNMNEPPISTARSYSRSVLFSPDEARVWRMNNDDCSVNLEERRDF